MRYDDCWGIRQKLNKKPLHRIRIVNVQFCVCFFMLTQSKVANTNEMNFLLSTFSYHEIKCRFREIKYYLVCMETIRWKIDTMSQATAETIPIHKFNFNLLRKHLTNNTTINCVSSSNSKIKCQCLVTYDTWNILRCAQRLKHIYYIHSASHANAKTCDFLLPLLAL